MEKEKEEKKVFERSVYAEKEFWNERFRKEKKMFDWYINWKQLKTSFNTLMLDKSARILIVGCGNSKLTCEMYKDGYKNLVNIDISDEVVKKMREWHEKEGVQCEWLEMDACNMSFEDESFDVVVDKGTMDAVLCGEAYDIPNKMLQEMYRVVKKDCCVMLVTHGNVANRKFLFEWNFTPQSTSVTYRQQTLSPEVNLINILRSSCKEKTLADVVKDHDQFAKCMVMWKLACNKKDNGISAFQPLEFEHMDIQHVVHKEPSPEEHLPDSPSDQTEAEEPPKEEAEDHPKEAVVGAEEKKKTVVKVKDSGYNPPRQDHCFIYLIRKLK